MPKKPVCRVTCYLPPDVVRRIDAQLPVDVARSRWLRRLIERELARLDRARRR